MNKVLDFKSFSKKGLNILIAGDIMMSPDMFEYIAKGNDPFKFLRKFFAGYDICIGNLETTFSGSDSGFPKFSSDDNYARLIKRYFQVVFTANNHCHDFGDSGIIRTIKTLDKEDILFVGTKKPGDRRNSLDVDVNDHDVTLLSYTTRVNGEESGSEESGERFLDYTSKEDTKELISFYDKDKVDKEIQSAKTRSDIVIVSIHGGDEYDSEKNQEQEARILNAIRHGADLVIGSHPHVFQGGFLRNDSYGVYSLGNFISNQDKLYDRDSGCIFLVKIDPMGEKTYSFLPICTFMHPENGPMVLPLSLIEQGYFPFIKGADRKNLFDVLGDTRKIMIAQGLTEEPFYSHLI